MFRFKRKPRAAPRRELDGLVVVVTGAASGVGKAIAAELNSRNCRLVLVDTSVAALYRLNKTFCGAHLCVEADVTKMADCQKIFCATRQHFGRIDTYVHGASYGLASLPQLPSEEDLCKTIGLHHVGLLYCVHLAFHEMFQQEVCGGYRGSIIIVSGGDLPAAGFNRQAQEGRRTLAAMWAHEGQNAAIPVTAALFEGYCPSAVLLAHGIAEAIACPVPEVVVGRRNLFAWKR